MGGIGTLILRISQSIQRLMCKRQQILVGVITDCGGDGLRTDFNFSTR
jgi:hypothetical protein